jgi:hypothetical protein
LPTVYREILAIMVKGGGNPGILCMALFTVGRESGRLVRRVGGLVVLGLVTAVASIRSSRIVPVVAFVAGDAQVGALQYPIVIMDRESCWRPARICCMALLAGVRDADGEMIGVGSLVICSLVAGKTGIGSGGVVPIVTGVAGDGQVCAG